MAVPSASPRAAWPPPGDSRPALEVSVSGAGAAHPSSSLLLRLRSLAKLRARSISDTCPISALLPCPLRAGSPAEMRTVTSDAPSDNHGTMLTEIPGRCGGRCFQGLRAPLHRLGPSGQWRALLAALAITECFGYFR